MIEFCWVVLLAFGGYQQRAERASVQSACNSELQARPLCGL